MEPALIIKIAIGVGGFAAWMVAGQIKAGAGQPAPIVVPPPVPRRIRRVRNTPPPLVPEPLAPGPSAPVAATHLDDASLVVTRPLRAQSRLQFRGSAALRRALVAREVLDLPLSLRPSRF
jgi:hypothetical protein